MGSVAVPTLIPFGQWKNFRPTYERAAQCAWNPADELCAGLDFLGWDSVDELTVRCVVPRPALHRARGRLDVAEFIRLHNAEDRVLPCTAIVFGPASVRRDLEGVQLVGEDREALRQFTDAVSMSLASSRWTTGGKFGARHC